nr:dihydropteroate synthase [Phytoactinopolyspora halotolerans]
MAIVNRTPDSFYDKGATFEFDRAWRRVEQVISEGADIIDIGGVKAGVGPPVSEAEEIDRTAGLVAEIHRQLPQAVISVDTYRAGVADVLCESGAHLINDAWAAADPDLAAVAARHGAGLVCSHTGGHAPRTDPHGVTYDDVMADVIAGTTGLARHAVELGVRPDGIVVDPTHDFGKNTYHSLEVSRRLGELIDTGWPVLVSLSRKDFVGETLDLPVAERLNGTLAATAVAAWQGARVFRAHDVAATRQVLDMVAAIKGDLPPRAPSRGLI